MDEIKCKCLTAIYTVKNGFLGGPREKKLTVQFDTPISVTVKQLHTREITIVANRDVPATKLYEVLSRIERLLMLFDGSFIPLDSLSFSNSDVSSDLQLHSLAIHCKNNRLAYFESADYCRYHFNKLIEYDDILSDELYSKWESILEELGMVHQVFLYSVSKSVNPADLACAFLVEQAEALVEIVKDIKKKYADLKPGQKGTSLRMCLEALLNDYGIEIFSAEKERNKAVFLDTLVNNRVRIMHIKRHQKGILFNGGESILYSVKMSLLYRRIMFDLLDIDHELYAVKLRECVSIWNRWDDTMIRFLNRLQ